MPLLKRLPITHTSFLDAYSELNDYEEDLNLVSGGYIVELDNHGEDNSIRMEEKGCVEGYKYPLIITPNSPENYSSIQMQFIEQQFNYINDAVADNDCTLWKYLDLDDAVRYYIVEEILCHWEAYHGSTYLFRDRGENQKWHFSPLWDCGHAFDGPVDDFFYINSPYGNTWIPSLKQNFYFNNKLTDTWLWFMSNKWVGIYDDITAYCELIKEAALSDWKRWENSELPDGGYQVANNSDMNTQKEKVLKFLDDRICWLKGQFRDWSDDIYHEPDRDTTEAASLPDWLNSSVSLHSFNSSKYFNLQGVGIDNPKSGIFIKIDSDGICSKVRLR